MPESENKVTVLNEAAPTYGPASDSDIDLSLLKDSLAKTTWERMQANDDALNYAESLRAAMQKRNAKFK
jgi:hypothetical protein